MNQCFKRVQQDHEDQKSTSQISNNGLMWKTGWMTGLSCVVYFFYLGMLVF